MSVVGSSLVTFLALSWWIGALATYEPLSYETTPGNMVPLLTAMICEKKPSLRHCIELNETLHNEISPSPRVDIVTDNTSIALLQSYIAETDVENSELKSRNIEQAAKILQLEGENQQLKNKVKALEVDFLPTHNKYPWLPTRSSVYPESLSHETYYQPTANLLRPVDCSDYLIVGAHKSGVYDIYPFKCRCSEPVKVWCDMETDGGGWTVIVNRNSTHPVNFSKSWSDYKQGFGNVSTEYWIGNEALNIMTNTRAYTLRLDVEQKDGGKRWAEWPVMVVQNEANKYKLEVPNFNTHSMTDNCLAQHNGKPFSTFDYDNDVNSRNCAEMKQSGFWYHNCATLDPTKPFNDDGLLNTACSFKVNGRNVPLIGKSLQLKIRPKICGELVKAVHFNTHTCEGHNG